MRFDDMILNDQRLVKIVSTLLCLFMLLGVLTAQAYVLADEDDTEFDDDTTLDDDVVEDDDDVIETGYIESSLQMLTPGDDVTFTAYFDGQSALAFSATFEYSGAVMQYKGFESLVEGFSMSVTQRSGEDGNAYLDVFGISDNFSASLKEEIPVISLDFSINEDAQEGSLIGIKMVRATVSDGISDYFLADLAFESSVSVEKVPENAVEAISINSKPLDGFSSDIFQYWIMVDYSFTEITVNVTCAEGISATVSGNTNLLVGDNTVTVEVHNEKGVILTYTISVQRLEDPHHTVSSDASLSGLELSAGFVSPTIEKGVFDYIIYLPADALELTLTPITANEFASAETISITIADYLDKKLEITVVAEDLSECKYTFTLFVTPDYNGEIPGFEKDPQIDPPGKTEPVEKDGLYLLLPKAVEEFLEKRNISATMLLIASSAAAALLAVIIVVLIIVAVNKKKKKVIEYVEGELEGDGVVQDISSEDIESDVF